MKPLWIAAVLFLASLSLRGQSPFFTVPVPKGVLRVALVPAENVTAADIEVVKKALERYYGVQVTTMPTLTLAGRVGVKGRSWSIRTGASGKRVVTDSTILEGSPFTPFLSHAGQGFDVVMGLMGYGLSTGKWTVRGVTRRIGNDTCAVVTTYLVRQQSATTEQYQFRLAKVALHEFGHALGLPHCGSNREADVNRPEYSDKTTTIEVGDPRCFMLQSTPDGTQMYATTNQLCEQCHSRIKGNARPLSFLRSSHP
ncbi:MAG: matrixin family metalloprotease [Cytophagales bacterium]|nr:matrixin family metalloprotease [Cytophagales bacterium]